MKFRNLETREVFDNIHSARHKFCENKFCFNCPVPNWLRRELLPEDSSGCCEFCEYHPIEAAALMGYEAIEDRKRLVEHQDEETGGLYYTVEKEANMDKPLKDWTLGELKDYCCRAPHDCIGCEVKGDRNNCPFDGEPAKWNLDEKPSFTQQDIEDAKMIRAVFGENGIVKRYDKATTEPYGTLVFNNIYINEDMLPSIKEGQEYTLDEIIGNES